MFKLLSVLLVAGATTTAGLNSVASCGCGSEQAAAPAPTATARAPRVPTAVTQNGRQSVRRYSVSPTPTYRAPAMRRGRSYNGPSWSATRKILGY